MVDLFTDLAPKEERMDKKKKVQQTTILKK
jgi:hypothetical protein